MSESTKEKKRCAHAECSCESNDTYCSDYCRDPRAMDPTCECGHPQCASGLQSVAGSERV